MLTILDPKWQLFVRLADLGSLSKAAVTLDVPQSMVSRHLAQLERECGTRLFRRTGRGVVLTEFGEQVLPRIKTMIADAEVLADDIRTSGGMPVGEVRVGLLPSTVPLLAARLFGTVQERFPGIRLHLTEGSSAQLEEQVHEGRVDMALLAREDHLAAHDDAPVLQRHGLYLVGRQDDPLLSGGEIKFDQLDTLPLVLPSAPHPLRVRLEQVARERGVTLDMAIDADSMRLQHAIAAAGGGYAITGGLVDPASSGMGLAAALITEPVLLRTLVLSTTLRRPHTRATREVYQHLQQWVPTVLEHRARPLTAMQMAEVWNRRAGVAGSVHRP